MLSKNFFIVYISVFLIFFKPIIKKITENFLPGGTNYIQFVTKKVRTISKDRNLSIFIVPKCEIHIQNKKRLSL